MNFVKYVDYKYQELAVDSNTKSFSSLRGGHENALAFVLKTYTILIAALFIPIVFIGYVLTTLRILREPLPALDLLKADYDSRDFQRKNYMKKKVGFQTKSKMKLPEVSQ